jgi:DNA-binding Lrp family transcriptional regulator
VKEKGLFGFEFQRMQDYLKTLDPINAKILVGLGKHDPRNISLIAKEAGLPNSTVAFRFKKLVKEHHLEIFAHLDWNKLGLERAAVVAEALPGRWKTIWKVFEDFDYLTYLARCSGKIQGCLATFAVPVEHKNELREYLDEAVRLEIISNYLLFWITNPCDVRPSFDWLDFEKQQWSFKWKEWVQEILDASESLSSRLADPKSHPILVDKKDLIMLEELEVNGIVSFKELAKVVGIEPSSVAYRYWKHIVERGLIIGHRIGILPYPYELTDFHSFFIKFEDEKALAKFTNSLHGKPFVINYAKVIGQPSIILTTCTPKFRFLELVESLDTLTEMRLIKKFSNVTLNIAQTLDKSLPSELFKEGTWIYNHDENLERLKELIETL